LFDLELVEAATAPSSGAEARRDLLDLRFVLLQKSRHALVQVIEREIHVCEHDVRRDRVERALPTLRVRCGVRVGRAGQVTNLVGHGLPPAVVRLVCTSCLGPLRSVSTSRIRITASPRIATPLTMRARGSSPKLRCGSILSGKISVTSDTAST